MADQVATGDLIDVEGAGGHHDKGQHESIITRIRSRTGSSSASHSLGIHRTSTRESQQSGGSHGESISSGHGLASLISNTRTFFKRHNRSGSVDTPSPTTATTPGEEAALQAAGLAGGPSTETARPPISSSTSGSNSGNESRREGTSSSTTLPPPIAPDRAFTPPPLRHTGAGGSAGDAHSSSDNNTTSSSSSIPHDHDGSKGGYSSSVATTVNSDVGSPNEEQQQQQQIQPSKPSPVVPPGTASRDFALPPGAAAALPAPSTSTGATSTMPLSTEARYRALPRLQSYSVTHPTASTSTSTNSEDHDAAEYDTTTSMSGTETEHDDEEEESEAEEEGEEEDDDDEHEHDEEDVRGGVNAMRTSLRRPALPTLSSTRGFSRSANTPGISPTTTTTSSNNPFSFQGWTTFASSTPTPGPLRTARPQSGDNTLNGSYFDPRPTSSSSRASTVFQTPAQTPRGENGPSPAISATSAGKARQQQQSPLNNAGLIPTPGASISPPSSRIRMEGPSRPSSGSPLAATAAGRRPSAGTFVRTANGQSIPLSSIPNISGLSTTPSSSASSRMNLASTSGNRPSFYSRQSKSLVDLSRSLSLDTDGTSAAAASATTAAAPSAISNKALITALSGECFLHGACKQRAIWPPLSPLWRTCS